MNDPIISEDGNWIWDGSGWIPIQQNQPEIASVPVMAFNEEILQTSTSEPWKISDFVYASLLPLGIVFGLLGVGASNAGFYIFTIFLNAILCLILCVLINKLLGNQLVKFLTYLILKIWTPKEGKILKIVNRDSDFLSLDRLRFSFRSTIFWTVIFISINVLILSNQMDALYAEDGGNKTPTNLEEWGYLVVWFLSGLVPSLLLPLIIPLTLILNCTIVIADVKVQNVKKLSSTVKSLFSGFVGASSFLAIFKFILANSGDPNGWGRLDSSQPLLAIFSMLHGSLFLGFLIHSIWHKDMIRRIESRLEELGNMKHHELSIDGDGIVLKKQ